MKISGSKRDRVISGLEETT